VANEDTKVDLKALAKRLGFGRLSFGKPDLLMEVLGIEPGSVTAFALINETSSGLAAVVVDEALMAFAEVNCHPLVNNATTRIATRDLIRFMEECGHVPRVLPLG
jgi:Ala-tRNA(Pro) deacylase